MIISTIIPVIRNTDHHPHILLSFRKECRESILSIDEAMTSRRIKTDHAAQRKTRPRQAQVMLSFAKTNSCTEAAGKKWRAHPEASSDSCRSVSQVRPGSAEMGDDNLGLPVISSLRDETGIVGTFVEEARVA